MMNANSAAARPTRIHVFFQFTISVQSRLQLPFLLLLLILLSVPIGVRVGVRLRLGLRVKRRCMFNAFSLPTRPDRPAAPPPAFPTAEPIAPSEAGPVS